MTMRTRFAPSPTGQLHVGNARTALFSALLAVQMDGAFVLRIEDTDAGRSRREFEASLCADLTWLGLHWQEGPDVGGPQGPYRQSERGAIYRRYLDKLTAAGLTYPCFCSPEELALARKRQLAAGKPPRYAGTCARLDAAEVQQRLSRGLQPALRFRVPDTGSTEFDDLVRGRQRFAHKDIGDFVIQRADGSPAFFFSNAVDDALMGITHVLRGEDHLANTPRQILLLKALDLPPPRYGHLSLIVGESGAPLSKREGGGSLQELRTEGLLPIALMNYLARLGHTYASNELLPLGALAEEFRVGNIGHAAAHFDQRQLEHWQRLAVRAASDERLRHWLTEHDPEIIARVPETQQAGFFGLVRENFSRPDEAALWAGILFADKVAVDASAASAVSAAGEAFFAQALACLSAKPAGFRAFAQAVQAETGASGRSLFAPLRAALTGQTHGPEMERIWPMMGPVLVESRLRAALAAARA